MSFLVVCRDISILFATWVCGSTWHGIVDGRVGCLDVALGVIDAWRAGRWMEGGKVNARLMLGVFDGGGALVAGGCSI